jgi:hypothetical protein
MAKGQRESAKVMEVWKEGQYVLLVDRFTNAKDEKYLRGDVLHLNEGEATRLGNANSIAPVGSLEARRAQASSIEDEEERERRMQVLRAEALEQQAKRLREEAEQEE